MQLDKNVHWPLPADELKCALHLARSLTRADMSVLLLSDGDGDVLTPAASYGISDAKCALVSAPASGENPFGMAVAGRRRVVVRDAWRREERFARLAQSLGFRSIELIPLIGLDDEIVGELVMMFRHSRGSNRKTLRLIEECARLIVITVQHARRALEAERARDAAEQLGRAKLQFLARMSHELRTPLQSISGYIDLLRAGDPRPTQTQSRMFARIQYSEKMLVHVVDDLITFSRLEAGQVHYDIAPVIAEEVVRQVEAIVASLAVERGVTLTVVPCAGIVVAADGDKLRQILLNLAANAVKFTERGTVRISCHVADDIARFDVADDGPGIPPNRFQEIFQPYVQLNTPLLDGYGGTGLGLAISREFAIAMRGDLTVSSTVGKGSVFSVSLPLVRLDGSQFASSLVHDDA
jgi:signal transduction histidine kinase